VVLQGKRGPTSLYDMTRLSEKTSVEEVEPGGTSFGYAYTVTYGEKDYPITRSGRAWDDPLGGAETIAIRRSGANEYSVALRKSGLVVMTMRIVVSKNWASKDSGRAI
jgi:hypothetical protein